MDTTWLAILASLAMGIGTALQKFQGLRAGKKARHSSMC